MLPTDYFRQFGLELIQDKIGQGGSAICHKCQIIEQLHKTLPKKGTFVAVKEFKEEMLANPGQLQRIEQEAKIGATATDGHLAKIYAKDVGEGIPPSYCVLFMEWYRWSHSVQLARKAKPAETIEMGRGPIAFVPKS